jgi:hypothetical protein
MNTYNSITRDDIKELIDEIKKLKSSLDVNINIQIVNQNNQNNFNSNIDSSKCNDIPINTNINDNSQKRVTKDKIECYIHKFTYNGIELNQITTEKIPLIEIYHVLKEDIKPGIIIDEFINYDVDRTDIEDNIFDISFNLTYINTIDYEIKRTIFEYIIQLYKPHKFNNLICVNNLYMCKISNTNIIDIINSN